MKITKLLRRIITINARMIVDTNDDDLEDDALITSLKEIFKRKVVRDIKHIKHYPASRRLATACPHCFGMFTPLLTRPPSSSLSKNKYISSRRLYQLQTSVWYFTGNMKQCCANLYSHCTHVLIVLYICFLYVALLLHSSQNKT